MSSRHLLTGLALIALLMPAGTAWAGAAVGDPCTRESFFIAHVCQGGSKDGQQCTVVPTSVTPCVFSTSDCPGGTCVIDYTSKKEIKAKLSLMVDDNVSKWGAPQRTLGRAFTFLLCVKKQGEQSCFTETYQEPQPSDAIDLLPFFADVTEDKLAGVSLVGDTQQQQQFLLQNWQFFVLDGSPNPEGGLAQELRDLFKVTGVPVITDIGEPESIFVDDHTGDLTGTVLRVDIKLRFVDQ